MSYRGTAQWAHNGVSLGPHEVGPSDYPKSVGVAVVDTCVPRLTHHSWDATDVSWVEGEEMHHWIYRRDRSMVLTSTPSHVTHQW